MSSRFKYWDIVLLLFICFSLVLIWFHSGLIVGGAEEGLAFYNPARTFLLSQSMWWDYNAGFPTLAWLPHVNTFLLLSILYTSFHAPNYLLQAGTFVLLLITGSTSTYFLATDHLGKVSNKNLIAFISGLFYICNPYSLSQIWGRGLTPQFFSFALLPLAIFLFLRGLRNKNIFYAFLLTFSSVVFSSAFGLVTFAMDYWSALTVVFVAWMFLNKKSIRKNIIFYFGYYILSLVLWSLCNFYWLLPTISSGQIIYSGAIANSNIDGLISVSQYFKLFVIIRLLQSFLFFNPGAFGQVYSSFIFQLISFLMPTFLFIGLFYILKKKELRELKIIIVLFVVGLFVSLGANPPLGWLLVWIFKIFPFLQALRNPYEKYGIVYALSYSLLFAVGLVYVFQNLIKNNIVKRFGTPIVLLLVCGIYIWPIWSGRVVAGANQRPGLEVPASYQSVDSWLQKEDTSGYRVGMIPFPPGEGASYQWGSSQYSGLEPTMDLLHTPAISSSPDFPFFYDVIQSITNSIYKQDVSGALSLLRVKYLVNREDEINISSTEKLHKTFLTDYIFPPNKIDDLQKSICSNIIASPITCTLDSNERDLHTFKYLHFVFQITDPLNMSIDITDDKGNAVHWFGNGQQTIIVPFGELAGNVNTIDFSKISTISINAQSQSDPTVPVKKIELQGIWLDPGTEQKVTNYSFVKSFGGLQLYKAKDFKAPPEFGILNSIEQVVNADALITKAHEEYQKIDKVGFIIPSQNKAKDLNPFGGHSSLVVDNSKNISGTRYWLRLKKPGIGYIILSKTYNPQWKVIPGVTEKELQGNFFDNVRLLKKAVLSENNHYVVNGYANLWKINGESDAYAIVFLPQLYADIGHKISLLSLVSTLLFAISYIVVCCIVKKYNKK